MIAVPAAIPTEGGKFLPVVTLYHGHRKVATVRSKVGGSYPFTYRSGAIGWASGWFKRDLLPFNAAQAEAE